MLSILVDHHCVPLSSGAKERALPKEKRVAEVTQGSAKSVGYQGISALGGSTEWKERDW